MKDKNIQIGFLGEDIASIFLKNKGFIVVGKNYRKKWGEIDVICKKEKVTHFIEVKTIVGKISSGIMPEENVHREKLKRLFRTIETYCAENKMGDSEWQLDVIAIFLDIDSKEAHIRMTENIVVE
ncbi:MAG: YraN family protein [Patescibacteria group bacterium]